MEPPQMKPRASRFSSQYSSAPVPAPQPQGEDQERAAKALAVAAKLSQTLMSTSPLTNPSHISNPAIKQMSLHGLNLDTPEIMVVPSNKVGQIIGRGGAKIREIQEKSGARMDIAKVSNPNTPHLRDIKLIGTKVDTNMARTLINELLEEIKQREGGFRSGLQAPDRTIEVPTSLVGLVIGKGGETIRRIMQETNCIIHVEKEDEWKLSGRKPPKPGHQNVYFKGESQALEQGVRAILELVQGATDRSKQYNYQQGGQMASYRPQQGYGMPGATGNRYAPGQNYSSGGPTLQANQPYQPSQPYQTPQPYKPNPQPYKPIQQPYTPKQTYSPVQDVYNPPKAGTPVQGPLTSQNEGYGRVYEPRKPISQTPYNPAELSGTTYNPAAAGLPHVPNSSVLHGQQFAQFNGRQR